MRKRNHKERHPRRHHPMASTPTTVLILILLPIFLLTQAHVINLDPSDHDALIIVQRGLGINLHKHYPSKASPCNTHGIGCKRRLSNSTSSVLKITHLTLLSQHLRGSISPAIAQLSELRELSLPNNLLIGQLPPQISHCRKLEVLNLKSNGLSGNVPPELSKLVRLRVLDLSSNRFSGDLSFLKYFPNLEVLSLSDNLFAGKVAASVMSFRNLRFFGISGNAHLRGPVPGLNGVEVDYESAEIGGESVVSRRFMLTGGASTSDPTTAAASAPAPNIIDVNSSSDQASSPSAAAQQPHHHEKHKWRTWLLGFVVGAAAGGVSGIVVSVLAKVIMILVFGAGKDNGIAIFSPLIKKKEDIAFLEKEDATENLELIGKGGCGEVYKAQLPGEDGKIVAIKKISEAPKDAEELTEEDTKQLNKKMRQIKSEIKTVGNIRHRNLLPLLAHVSRPNFHYLVYEFMKNGSLQDAMQGEREMDWPTRYRIALGIASGLEHLHMNTRPKVIHRDLKPANVLLDDDLEPRITDFGLAKAMPDGQTHISSSNVAGTLGYIAPEYHQTFKFTDKCDIYSYGVMLGGLMTGKHPTDQFFQETDEVNMVKWMRNVLTSEDPKRAIDEKLLGNGCEEQMLQVLKIACFCTVEDFKRRPNSKEVRDMLSQIKPY